MLCRIGSGRTSTPRMAEDTRPITSTPRPWRTLVEPRLRIAKCAARGARAAGIAGNALRSFGDRLPTFGATLAPDAAPHALALLALAEAAWARGDAVDPALALPLYVRDKVAQTTLERDAARGERV